MVLWYANSTLKIMSIVLRCSEPRKDRRAKRTSSLTFYHLRKAKATSPKIQNNLHMLISIVLNYWVKDTAFIWAHSDGKWYTLDGKVSWQLGAKEYHKVSLHNKPHAKDLLGGGKNNNRRVVVSAWSRNNRDMSERQGLYSFSLVVEWGGTFQGGDW